MKTKEPIETIEMQQEHRNERHAVDGQDQAATPPNAPEQRNAGFATGEADPTKYPADLEIGRFSTGQDESEPVERGCFAEGQETEPKAIDPDEGFAERDSQERHSITEHAAFEMLRERNGHTSIIAS